MLVEPVVEECFCEVDMNNYSSPPKERPPLIVEKKTKKELKTLKILQ